MKESPALVLAVVVEVEVVQVVVPVGYWKLLRLCVKKEEREE